MFPRLKEDLQGAARLGLCRAAVKYRSSRGVAFRTYAYRVIRGAVLDEIRKNYAIWHRDDLEQERMTWRQPKVGDSGIEKIDRDDWHSANRRVLSPREQAAYVCVYERGMTQQETARCLGVSQPYVCVLLARARAWLMRCAWVREL